MVGGFPHLARLAPKRRLRRFVFLLGFYAAALALAAALSWTSAPGLTVGLKVAAQLLQLLLVINLLAITVFDLLLRALRVDYPDILHDVMVGAA